MKRFAKAELSTLVNECVKKGTRSVTGIATRKLSRRLLLAEKRITAQWKSYLEMNIISTMKETAN